MCSHTNWTIYILIGINNNILAHTLLIYYNVLLVWHATACADNCLSYDIIYTNAGIFSSRQATTCARLPCELPHSSSSTPTPPIPHHPFIPSLCCSSGDRFQMAYVVRLCACWHVNKRICDMINSPRSPLWREGTGADKRAHIWRSRSATAAKAQQQSPPSFQQQQQQRRSRCAGSIHKPI